MSHPASNVRGTVRTEAAVVVDAAGVVSSVIADRQVAEGYIGKVCFKTGPPARVGVELEWTVHHLADPLRPFDISVLAATHGPHAPPTLVLGSAHQPLTCGGQVEIFTPALASPARHVLDTPLLCLRRPGERWDALPEVTFADWIDAALPAPPTFNDLRYHLSTLFPAARPRGYYDVRYLDAQPGADWARPVAMLAALFASEETFDAAAEIAAPAADRWLEPARPGLSDVVIASVIPCLTDLACQALSTLICLPPLRVILAKRLSKHSKGGNR